MGEAERADLIVARTVAVEQQKIGDAIIALRQRDAGVIDDRDGAHDGNARQRAV